MAHRSQELPLLLDRHALSPPRPIPNSERKRHISFYHISFLCRPSSPELSQGRWLPSCKIRRKPGCVPGTRFVPNSQGQTGSVAGKCHEKADEDDNFTSLLQVLQTFEASKAPFLTLRVATPSMAPRQAPLEMSKNTPQVSSDLRDPQESFWEGPGVVTRATGPKSLCLCAFFLPDLSISQVVILGTTRAPKTSQSSSKVSIVGVEKKKKKHDSHRRDRILRFFLRPEIGQSSPRSIGILPILHDSWKIKKPETQKMRKSASETQKISETQNYKTQKVRVA